MKLLNQLMQQAQAAQAKLAQAQERLAQEEISGSAGSGSVTLTLTGKGALKRIKLDPMLLKPADATLLEDLILAAFNDARGKQEALQAEAMHGVTSGLPLPPGLKLF